MQLHKPLVIFAFVFFATSEIAGASPLPDETDDGSQFERQLAHLSPEQIDSMEQMYHDKIGCLSIGALMPRSEAHGRGFITRMDYATCKNSSDRL